MADAITDRELPEEVLDLIADLLAAAGLWESLEGTGKYEDAIQDAEALLRFNGR